MKNRRGRPDNIHQTVAPERVPPNSDATARYMIFAMLPLWVIPGILDYFWHRRTSIETTSGTEESLTHALMMIEVGPPVMAGLFLEMNAGVIALIIAAYLAHEATINRDSRYTADKRPILAGEQHTHSYLEMVPFCSASFAICVHWDQFLALIGRGSEPARFAFRLRRPPVPIPYVLSILSAVGLSVALPHAEELWRCWQAEKRGRSGRDTPECLQQVFGDQKNSLVQSAG
jgi:hypothetical protein